MDKQPRADKEMEYPRLDHTGQNKKERLKQNDNKMRRKQSRRLGLKHTGRNKQQGPPPPGLEHPGTFGGQTPQTGASGAEQGAWAPPGMDHPGTSGGRTPRTGSSGVDQAARAAAPRNGSSGDKARPDAPEWNIRAGTGSRSHRIHDTKVEGHMVGRRPGLGHLGQNKKEQPQPPGRGKDGCRPGQECPGRINQKGSPPPGLERPGESGGQRRRKQEAETKVVQRRRQDPKQRKRQSRGNAGRQRTGRGRRDAGQHGAVVKQKNRPMAEAGVMQ